MKRPLAKRAVRCCIFFHQTTHLADGPDRLNGGDMSDGCCIKLIEFVQW